MKPKRQIFFLIYEVCFTVLFEVVFNISVLKVKEVAQSMQRKYMDGTYILIASQRFLLQIYSDEEQQPSRPYQNPAILSKRTFYRVQFVIEWLKSTEEHQIKLNRTP